MATGRPQNSKTPAWRSKPAIKVRAYRFLMGDKGTKADCANVTNLSRTTVIKWYDQVAWTPETSKNFEIMQNWMIDHAGHHNISAKRCAAEVGLPLEIIQYEFKTLNEISVILRGKEADF